MRRTLLFLCAGALGCGESQKLFIAPTTETALLHSLGQLVLLDLETPRELGSGDDFTILEYKRSLDALLLEVDGDRVRLADASVDAEKKWTLPIPDAAVVFSAETASVDGIHDRSALRESVRAIDVPAPKCPELVARETHPFPFDLAASYVGRVASVGDVLLLVAPAIAPGVTRLFWNRGAEFRELTLEPALSSASEVFAFGDDGAFWVAEVTPTHTRVHTVSLEGEASSRSEAETSTFSLSAGAHWPGQNGFFALQRENVMRFDAGTGTWSTIASVAVQPPQAHCDNNGNRPTFFLESEQSGIFSARMDGVFRFDRDGSIERLVDTSLVGNPCFSSYSKFPAGAEFVFASHIDAAGVRRQFFYRPTPTDAWEQHSIETSIVDAIVSGERIVSRNATTNVVEMWSHDARRSDIRPRICSTLEVGGVRHMVLDADVGFAIQRDVFDKVFVTRFEIRE